MSKKIQELIARIRCTSGQTLISFGLVFVSLIILLMAFRVNFDQNALFTRVITVDSAGQERVLSFREYRSETARDVYDEFSECLQINELFGDGTGQECDQLESQYWCIKESGDQEQVASCA